MAAEKYRAAWNPTTHTGRVKIYTGRGDRVLYEFDDPAEFTAVLTLLASSDEIRIRDGYIRTSDEPIDGE